MIPALIVWLIKRYLLPAAKSRHSLTPAKSFSEKKAAPFIIFLLLFAPAAAQPQVYRYSIIYKGDNIGKMDISQTQTGDELYIKIVSHVQMRMLVKIKVNVEEESRFLQDKLIRSSVYREVNGKEKTNRQTTLMGENYRIISEGKTGTLYTPAINYNLVRLYNKEPVNITQVYSDSFQQFLSIKNAGPHCYKLELPNGNYNIYYYQNGICHKVDVRSRLFSVQMQLVN